MARNSKPETPAEATEGLKIESTLTVEDFTEDAAVAVVPVAVETVELTNGLVQENFA